MTIEFMIKYEDMERKDLYHPFSFQSVYRECWAPIAVELRLELLERLESLEITELTEARGLILELERVGVYISSGDVVKEDDRIYMLRRIREIIPLILGAIDEWDQVSCIAL